MAGKIWQLTCAGLQRWDGVDLINDGGGAAGAEVELGDNHMVALRFHFVRR